MFGRLAGIVMGPAESLGSIFRKYGTVYVLFVWVLVRRKNDEQFSRNSHDRYFTC